MSDPKIPVAQTVELIDALVQQPANGTKVLALTLGGVLVQTVWNSRSIEAFEAWCKHPAVPASVKQRMVARYRHD